MKSMRNTDLWQRDVDEKRGKLWSAHPCCCFVAALPCGAPSLSHLCNSISMLQWALIDLFRRSTKWLAQSHSFFPSLSLLLQPTQACRWHTLPFIIQSLIYPLLRYCCHSMFTPTTPADTARKHTPQLTAKQTARLKEQRTPVSDSAKSLSGDHAWKTFADAQLQFSQVVSRLQIMTPE